MEKQQARQTFPANENADKMGTTGENATPDDNIAIRVSHVSKYFKLPTEPTNSLRRAVVNRFKGIKGYRRQEVLKDISFNIEKGDFFGIVGRNGSGKSTLLKIISRIYKPNAGNVEINGRLVSFIELGVGFNDELSGRENVYLNGAMLGFSTTEVDEMYNEIVEFSELQDFMDQKLKNYSSGMQVRLAFSVAIMAKGDILVLDEVLAVGDEAFQRKCFNYFAKLKRDKKTVILVTHDMDSVRRFCNKALMIEQGNIVEYGNVGKVSQRYSELFVNPEDLVTQESDDSMGNSNVVIEVQHEVSKEKLAFDLSIMPKVEFEDAVLTFAIMRDSGEMVSRWATDDVDVDSDIMLEKDKQEKISIVLQNVFPNGTYDIQVAIKKRDRSYNYAVFNGIDQIEIIKIGINGPFWTPTYSVKTVQEL